MIAISQPSHAICMIKTLLTLQNNFKKRSGSKAGYLWTGHTYSDIWLCTSLKLNDRATATVRMMHQMGFMNSPSQMGQQQQQQQQQQHGNPSYGSMNQMSTGPTNVGSGGMQFSTPSPQTGMSGMGSGFNQPGITQMNHPSQIQQQQSQQHHSPLVPPGPRSATQVSSESGSTQGNPAPVHNQPLQQSQQSNQQMSSKELNAASLCRFGQETVQEIVSRTQEVFQTLRTAQPPDGKTYPGIDRKSKFQETLKTIRALFKRLRVIYEKIEESFPASEDTYFEDSLPFKDGNEITVLDEKKNTEAYRVALEEYRDMIEQLVLRNRHLKETVDHLRHIIWDINTMLAMRKE
ncbi:unnamed protein product [Allacma fusca]|uniref:Mediator of RNA polymerase II transcription subunit 30 n=1 Tax=Allacma fusca TaxID=39272 RepID=A0A8J2JXB0_9HEXA|nr:unnamed protein product [Allacma fusca]